MPTTTTRTDLLVQDSDATFRRFVQDLIALCGRIEQVRTGFAKRLGLTGPQYNVFLFLAQNQGRKGLTVSRVAEGLLVTTAYVTREVNQLIDLGLVTKSPNPDDGRSVLLSLTDAGAKALAALAPAYQSVNDEMFRSLDRDRFLTLSAIVERLLRDAERSAKRISLHLDD
ncbi:MAG: MarR family winged helix-turn-helix transcriptional regulator [Pseudomonadota bacterium]